MIFADFKDLYKLTASVCGLLDSGSVQGSVNLRTMRLNDLPDLNECVYSLPWYLNELIADDLYKAFPLYTGVNFDIRRLSNIVTADEAQLMLAALSPQAVPLPLSMKDALCAGTLRSMILALAKRRNGV